MQKERQRGDVGTVLVNLMVAVVKMVCKPQNLLDPKTVEEGVEVVAHHIKALIKSCMNASHRVIGSIIWDIKFINRSGISIHPARIGSILPH